jgi:uncharacterized protein YkwD
MPALVVVVACALALGAAGATTQPLVERMNAAREARGRAQLAIDAGLARAAGVHARSMARLGYFAHDDPDGAPFWKRIQRYYPVGGYSRWQVGENIYWSPATPTAAKIVQTWLVSPEHARVLYGNWGQVGVAVVAAKKAPGVFGGRDATIVVADFGRRTR